jgi:O-Antigen ligase
MLQIFTIAVMVFPADTVIGPIGAAGYPASLVGVVIFGIFLATVVAGFHDPTRRRHPIQAVVAVLWVSWLASYIFMDRGQLTGLQVASADRKLIQLAVITGVVLVAAEWLRSFDDVKRVVRVLCWAGAFSGFVSVLQFWLSIDLSQYLRQLPGFVINHDNPAILAREGLNRVQGTAITPIEFGEVMGFLTPLAIWLGMYERDKSRFKRWAPLGFIVLGVATSVSRSAILSVFVAFVVLVVAMPPLPRLAALCVVPIAIAGLFFSAHGLMGEFVSFFSASKTANDDSVLYRTHDYPLAEKEWGEAPWFGHGPGTWISATSIDIFDNEFLNSLVELGAVGVFALLVFLLLPAIAALSARRRSTSPELRLLCAALAGGGFAAAAGSFTFDSMSFPMFVNVYALMTGLAGACWCLAMAEQAPATGTLRPAGLVPAHIEFPRPHPFWQGRAES